MTPIAIDLRHQSTQRMKWMANDADYRHARFYIRPIAGKFPDRTSWKTASSLTQSELRWDEPRKPAEITRCGSGRDRARDNLAISVEEPRKYISHPTRGITGHAPMTQDDETRLPKAMLRRLDSAGIYCQTWVTAGAAGASGPLVRSRRLSIGPPSRHPAASTEWRNHRGCVVSTPLSVER